MSLLSPLSGDVRSIDDSGGVSVSATLPFQSFLDRIAKLICRNLEVSSLVLSSLLFNAERAFCNSAIVLSAHLPVDLILVSPAHFSSSSSSFISESPIVKVPLSIACLIWFAVFGSLTVPIVSPSCVICCAPGFAGSNESSSKTLLNVPLTIPTLSSKSGS